MKNLFALLSVFALFFLAGCDTSNPMLAPLPVTTGVATPPVVSSPAPTPTAKPTPTPVPTGYTLQDVQKHNTASDCRTVIAGKIYNMSSFSSRHPGGADPILSVCGKDGSVVFNKKHGTKIQMIEQFFVADLQ